ncbi:uncharacterized protein THITE_2141915 [Thermothielavioides terrestris NRRL 8126]|uniref:Zn(2)-C6 fungal-type domain-containing protein n=1 Tax=Thermothielavioides terrestris (strain ATCC 38088 / NRRL 8126) TaxID=578455 RepID=G2QWF7_THETT|nr:uncharacterized protein THITE_2141915 [Thermothielavioides terrestris NRRL 8126]AEO63932.1 hypothetical protein THITE_2141915 [Thermothielavioides terrestris NRRL 8126]
MNSSGSEPPRASGEPRTRPVTANKACVPCRLRKVKCDAAAVGLPCSSCTSRERVKDCVLPARKRRTNDSEHRLDFQSPRQTEPDLLYLNILNDAVKETTEPRPRHTTSGTTYCPRSDNNFTPRNCLRIKLPQFDDVDKEYLVKKGVFDLPPPAHLDALIKAYFDHVHPFCPVINRADFIRGYRSGTCSLFLLRAILTPASVHAPADVLISGCGFASRSAAQESFFCRAKLVHDFAAEDDPLVMLQGSIILCMIVLDHPSDPDFGYWLHNAVRLAAKLDLRNICVREDEPPAVLKLYRRIWWALYVRPSLDIFHVFANPRRSRLLEDTPAIKPRTEDDWEPEEVSDAPSGLLSPVTPQQRALPVVQCELSGIFAQCLSIVTSKHQQDLRPIMHTLDAWRGSLAAEMHVAPGNTGTDIYYLHIQAMSYRFECVLCRLMHRRWQQQSQHADLSEWARQRLRTAVLELDTIAMRVLASGNLADFPISFVTTMTALLALHVETALDPAETDLARSMARISISQTMLLLDQGREIPVLKRALPIFEEILARKNLCLVAPPAGLREAPAPSQSRDNGVADACALPQLEPCEHDNPAVYGDLLGFDFLDEWQIGQLDFADHS